MIAAYFKELNAQRRCELQIISIGDALTYFFQAGFHCNE